MNKIKTKGKRLLGRIKRMSRTAKVRMYMAGVSLLVPLSNAAVAFAKDTETKKKGKVVEATAINDIFLTIVTYVQGFCIGVAALALIGRVGLPLIIDGQEGRQMSKKATQGIIVGVAVIYMAAGLAELGYKWFSGN